MSSISENEILLRIRSDVESLCASSDQLMQPQYRHLLARVEALIAISFLDNIELAASGSASSSIGGA